MDNHYHLLLETPFGNLPQIMRHINGAYTTYFNVKRARSGHLFQGRYKAILVEADEYAMELSRYIHLNPVRSKMVETPDAYGWSSYNFYIGRKKAPQWLQRDFILGSFGTKVSTAEKGYEEFVLSLVNLEYDSPLKDVTGSVLLGSLDFIELIREKFLSGQEPDRDLPAVRELAPRLSMQEVFDAVESHCGEQPALARNLKMYLCWQYTGEKLKTIGEHFGVGDSAVSQASNPDIS